MSSLNLSFPNINRQYFSMSRAIDTETASSLTKSNPQDVYTSLATILSPEPPTLIEIEFLGKSHPLPPDTHFLEDGNSIAIPKSALVQAWMYARQLFFEQLKPFLESVELHEELWKATAVILLMDSEHLTAANSRKRVLKLHQKTDSKTEFEWRLRRELLFVDSYLTSRLHRHTKSPTLWSHRRWLLGIFKAAGLKWDAGNDLEVVLVAAERHPRNYYAWLHLRWLTSWEFEEDFDFDGVLQRVKGWCLRHPGDTSGFSYLKFYLEYLNTPKVVLKGFREGKDATQLIFREVLGLANTFKWTHESVWVFLRITVIDAGRDEDVAAFFEVNKLLVAASREDSKATKVLKAAVQWYEQNK